MQRTIARIWETVDTGLFDGGTSWFEIIARGLGVFMIAMGVLGAALLGYLAWRVGATETMNAHLQRISEYTYEALEVDEGEDE